MRINEIFYSIQGEGHFAGTPAVFVRFSGCNLACVFCDTKHQSFTEMTEDEIIAKVSQYPTHHVVITGGEPMLQLTSSLVEKLHGLGKFVQIETNGTQPLPPNCHIDWITCSPKYRPVLLHHIDELKVVYQTPPQDMSQYGKLKASVYSLQPCDVADPAVNAQTIQNAFNYCLQHPKWHLSLQIHKLINVR